MFILGIIFYGIIGAVISFGFSVLMLNLEMPKKFGERLVQYIPMFIMLALSLFAAMDIKTDIYETVGFTTAFITGIIMVWLNIKYDNDHWFNKG
jgi:drug/metabolite transporter superfamily protein YnfA